MSIARKPLLFIALAMLVGTVALGCQSSRETYPSYSSSAGPSSAYAPPAESFSSYGAPVASAPPGGSGGSGGHWYHEYAPSQTHCLQIFFVRSLSARPSLLAPFFG